MAHPCRDQVPFTAQCGFYSRFFVSQGNAPHLALWVRTVRHRETKWWHQGHTFWQRMKLNPNPLTCGLAVSESCGKGQPWALHRVERSSMCSLPVFPSQICLCFSDSALPYQVSQNWPLWHHFWSDFWVQPSARFGITNLLTKMACCLPLPALINYVQNTPK